MHAFVMQHLLKALALGVSTGVRVCSCLQGNSSHAALAKNKRSLFVRQFVFLLAF